MPYVAVPKTIEFSQKKIVADANQLVSKVLHIFEPK